MKLIYVPQQQCSVGYTEYVSGPNGMFESQVKALGVDIMSIRPHDRTLPHKPDLVAKTAWGFEQAQQLIQMLSTGFINVQDVIFMDQRIPGLEHVRAAAEASKRNIKIAYKSQFTDLVFNRSTLLDFANVNGEDYDPSDKTDSENCVVFPCSFTDGSHPEFFFQLVESVLSERNDICFAACPTQAEPRYTAIAQTLEQKWKPNFRLFDLTKQEYFQKLINSMVVFTAHRYDSGASYTLLEAAVFGCAPLFPDTCSQLLGHGLYTYKPDNVFDAKMHLYAILGGPIKKLDWIYRVSSNTTQRILYSLGFDVPKPPDREIELTQITRVIEKETHR